MAFALLFRHDTDGVIDTSEVRSLLTSAGDVRLGAHAPHAHASFVTPRAASQ